MPVLDNPKHEAFAQGIAKGQDATEAYGSAGYEAKGNATRACASRLLTSANIQSRIAELQARVAEKVIAKTALSKEWVISMLETNARLAQEVGKFNDSTAAVKLIGSELHKMFVDRHENGKAGEFDDLDATGLRAVISGRLGLVGSGDSSASSAGEQGSVRSKPH